MKKISFYLNIRWFWQQENKKVFNIPVITALVIIVGFFFAISASYDGINDIPVFTTTITKVLSIMWCVLCIGWVALGIGTENVSIAERDKHWRTQLLRFKDPDYLAIKLNYPNWKIREKELEEMWKDEYGLAYDETKNPFFSRWKAILLVFVMLLGAGIGTLIGLIF